METDTTPDEAEDDAGEVLERDFGPAQDFQKWRDVAKAYDSQYKGPAHWVFAINVLAATGSIALACRESGITKAFFTRRRDRYPEFAEAVLQALQFFREGVLEKAALNRAVHGVLEPVFYKGTKCGVVRKYSDSLLAKMLEAKMPEQYRSKADNSAPSTVTVIGGLPPDEDEPAPEAAQPKAPAPDDDPLA